MVVIGLTGGIASGKSNASRVLKSLGADVIDADAIARELTNPGGGAADAVQKRFGTLDRRAIGQVVFSDAQARQDLNAIVHPLVHMAIRAAVQASKADVVVLDVPLLFESGMESMADEVWVVHVPEAEQVRRVMKRDSLSREDALARIRSQMPTEEKILKATHAIDTSGSKEKTRRQIKALYQGALQRAGVRP